MAECRVDGCGKDAHSRGLCGTCYGRARRAGNLEEVALPKGKSVQEAEGAPVYREIEPIVGIPPKDWKPGITVVTCAQNNTGVHQEFLETLKAYCHARNAELLVAPIEHHPHGKAATGDVMWHPSVSPLLITREHRLAPDLVLFPTMPVIPTAVRPLSSLGNFGGGDSVIIGHSKVAMESVATPVTRLPKFLYSTGSVTIANYSTSKAGRRAEFHHTLSALVVEVADNGRWWVRQLHWSNSTYHCVHDLGRAYYKDAVKHVGASAVVMGDLHVGQMCYPAFDSTLRLQRHVSARAAVLHDVYDGFARNVHELDKAMTMFQRHSELKNCVLSELEYTANMVNQVARNSDVLVAYSNHDTMLERWVDKADYRQDHANAQLILEIELFRRNFPKEDVFKNFIGPFLNDNVTVLGRDETRTICGIEVGQHGHMGANGARGNPMAFARLGLKTVTGHTHSAGIFDGAYVVGVTGKLEMSYTKGLSSWSHTHCLIHPGGKRQHVTLSHDHKFSLADAGG